MAAAGLLMLSAAAGNDESNHALALRYDPHQAGADIQAFAATSSSNSLGVHRGYSTRQGHSRSSDDKIAQHRYIPLNAPTGLLAAIAASGSPEGCHTDAGSGGVSHLRQVAGRLVREAVKALVHAMRPNDRYAQQGTEREHGMSGANATWIKAAALRLVELQLLSDALGGGAKCPRIQALGRSHDSQEYAEDSNLTTQ